MKVPSETVITLSFTCPSCKKETRMTGEIWNLVESTRGDGYYATDEDFTRPCCSAYSNNTSITCLDNDRIRRSANGWNISANWEGIAMMTRGLCRSVLTTFVFPVRLRRFFFGSSMSKMLAILFRIVNANPYRLYTCKYVDYICQNCRR